MGSSESKLHCRCSSSQRQTALPLMEVKSLLVGQQQQQEEKLRQVTWDSTKEPEATAAEAEAEFALNRLPYECLRRVTDHLSSDDLLSLCQTSPENCRTFGAGVFWYNQEGGRPYASCGGPCGGVATFECLNAALERKLCLPVESLNGTYLPSLEDAESYSGRVVYLHDLNCRGSDVNGMSGVGCGSGGGGRLCIHDVVACVPRGTYLVCLRAKLSPHWRLKGVTEVLLVPDPACPGVAPLRARIPERKWSDLAFRHGFEHWFSVSLGRLSLPQSCSVQVQIVNAKVSKTQLKEGVYLDHIELAPLHCPLAQFTGYRRTALKQQRRPQVCGTVCQLL